jgi:hypothetical protein
LYILSKPLLRRCGSGSSPTATNARIRQWTLCLQHRCPKYTVNTAIEAEGTMVASWLLTDEREIAPYATIAQTLRSVTIIVTWITLRSVESGADHGYKSHGKEEKEATRTMREREMRVRETGRETKSFTQTK